MADGRTVAADALQATARVPSSAMILLLAFGKLAGAIDLPLDGCPPVVLDLFVELAADIPGSWSLDTLEQCS